MSQPPPVPSNRPRIADRVIEDVADRLRTGQREYGTALQAHNGRRALQDLYEELLDGAHYVRQRIYEEDQALREVIGDESVRTRLAELYDRIDVVRRNPGKISQRALERRYCDDVDYLRQAVEALLTELVLARQTPPPPPEGTEVALYQYRCAHVSDPPVQGEDYGQKWVDDWVAWPGMLVEGYYPEYRPLYGGQWYRVDPERPPVQPESSEGGPDTQQGPEGHEKALRALAGTDERGIVP